MRYLSRERPGPARGAVRAQKKDMRFFLLLFFLFPIISAAEPATVIRATELKQEPATDAAAVAQLPEGTAVEALERKSGWTRVKAPAGEGWGKMLALRYGGAAAAKQAA